MKLESGVLIVLLLVGHVALAQNGAPTPPSVVLPRLAPVVPAPRSPLTLVLTAPSSGAPAGSDLEVIRYGQGGRVLRPAALDLAEEIEGVTLHRWDWLHLDGRDLEIASREPYQVWLRAHAGMQGVLLSDSWLELFGGSVDWRDESMGADARSVSSGQITVTGRGAARIIRDLQVVTVVVAVGRFEVERQGRLIAVLGPGQHGEFSLAPSDFDQSEATGLGDAIGELRGALNDALEVLLTGGPLSGEELSALWEAVVRTGPAYFAAERARDPAVPPPDTIRRDVGEALRLLGAFGFEPPPDSGM